MVRDPRHCKNPSHLCNQLWQLGLGLILIFGSFGPSFCLKTAGNKPLILQEKIYRKCQLIQKFSLVVVVQQFAEELSSTAMQQPLGPWVKCDKMLPSCWFTFPIFFCLSPKFALLNRCTPFMLEGSTGSTRFRQRLIHRFDFGRGEKRANVLQRMDNLWDTGTHEDCERSATGGFKWQESRMYISEATAKPNTRHFFGEPSAKDHFLCLTNVNHHPGTGRLNLPLPLIQLCRSALVNSRGKRETSWRKETSLARSS